MKKSINALPLRNVVVDDPFWKRYVELVRGTVLPYQWDILNDRVEGAGPSCCIRNFRIAAGEIRGPFGGMVFQDSDVYKWIEAVAYSLCMCPDAKLEALADGAIDILRRSNLTLPEHVLYYKRTGNGLRFSGITKTILPGH